MRRPAVWRIFWGLYSVILVALALGSVVDSWMHDSGVNFALEFFTDVAVVAGLLLYLSGVRSRQWLIPASLSVLFQVYLLVLKPFPDLETAVLFLAFVLPGFVASALVAHVRSPALRAAA